jgi:hypothetical protein
LLTFRRAHDLDPHRFIRVLNWRLAVRHRHLTLPGSVARVYGLRCHPGLHTSSGHCVRPECPKAGL